MTGFFRKLRQSSLSGGKFRKYVLYAVGEIVLVVIGILIALQINTYSEYQKERRSGKMSYVQNDTLRQNIFDYYRNARESDNDGTTRPVVDEELKKLK